MVSYLSNGVGEFKRIDFAFMRLKRHGEFDRLKIPFTLGLNGYIVSPAASDIKLIVKIDLGALIGHEFIIMRRALKHMRRVMRCVENE